MSDLSKLENELNQMIEQGQGFPAGFDKFYADDVVMIEGTGERCEGKEANREREQEFMGQVKEFHGARCVSSAVGDNVTFSEWQYDMTLQNGYRAKMEEVSRREWKNGKIVNERFYYNTQPPQE